MDQEKTRIIRGCYLFDGVEPEGLSPLARASSFQDHGAGQSIFMAGDDADGLRVVLSGCVRIWIADEEGRELTLGFMEAGDPFGEIALLDGLPRTANATSLEASRCLFLPMAAMEAALAADPALARHLLLALCELLRRNLGTISGFAFAGLGARLARKLYELAMDHAEITGGTARFSRRFSQTELALLLGVTREAVNKRLKALEHDGLLSRDAGWLVVQTSPPSRSEPVWKSAWAASLIVARRKL